MPVNATPAEPELIKTVAIFGVGLIGGSFARALTESGFRGTMLGVSSPLTIQTAVEAGVIDQGVTPEEACARAQLIYLAQPVAAILQTIRTLNPWLRPETLVTDAGSTKAIIVREARQHITHCQFLGGHPMAGKETRGVASADPSLFFGRTYILTPTLNKELDTPLAQEFQQLLLRIGARQLVLKPEEHDEVVAVTSHVPQLVSTALAELFAGELARTEHRAAIGPGGLEMTRLARSQFPVWRDILATNQSNVRKTLKTYRKLLEQLEKAVGDESMERHFRQASETAEGLRRPDTVTGTSTS